MKIKHFIKTLNLFVLYFGVCVAVFTNKLYANQFKELTLAVGISVPPYINRETNDGIELKVIREAFAMAGYKVKLKFLSNLGVANNFKAGQVDAMLVNWSKAISGDEVQPVFPSSTIINYHNYAISLKNSSHQIKNINSLSKFRVMGFSNAKKALGADFAQAVVNSELYKEVNDQTAQVIALYRGLIDVVIADPIIFLHFQNKFKKATGEYHEVIMHDVFPPSSRHIVFINRKDRESFNRGLRKIKTNGRYQSILESNKEYITRYH